MDKNQQLRNQTVLSEYGFNKNKNQKKQVAKQTILKKSSKINTKIFSSNSKLNSKQLNILNENNKQNIKIKVNKKPNLNINNSYSSNKSEKKILKIKIIQTWWKKIFKIIKLQNNIRCFLSKKKLQLYKCIDFLPNIIYNIVIKRFFNFLKNNKKKSKCLQKLNEKTAEIQKISSKKVFLNKIYINQITSSASKNCSRYKKSISYRKPKSIFGVQKNISNSKIAHLKECENLKKNTSNKINLKNKINSRSIENVIKSPSDQKIKKYGQSILESKKINSDSKFKKEESITVINNINNIYNNNILGYCPYWNENNSFTSRQTKNNNNFSYIFDNENIINSYFNPNRDNSYYNISNNIANNIPNKIVNTYRNFGEIPSLLKPTDMLNISNDNNELTTKNIYFDEYFDKWKKLSVMSVIIRKLRCLYLLGKFLEKKYMKKFLEVMKRKVSMYDSWLRNKEYKLLKKFGTFNGENLNNHSINLNIKKERTKLININNGIKNLKGLIDHKSTSFRPNKFNQANLIKNLSTNNNQESNNQSQVIINKIKNKNFCAYKNLKKNIINSNSKLLTDRSVRSINNTKKNYSSQMILTERKNIQKNFNKKNDNQVKLNNALKKVKIINRIHYKKDLIAQINQLTMVFNLLDQFFRKNKLKVYFKEWNKISNQKSKSFMIMKNNALRNLLNNPSNVYTKPHYDSMRANSINTKKGSTYQTVPVSLKSIYIKKVLPQSFGNGGKTNINVINKNNVLSMDFCDILNGENSDYWESPEKKYGVKKVYKIEEKEIKFNVKKNKA